MATGRSAQHAMNIMNALSEARRPLSAYDLLEQLRPTGIAAPVTVYRALAKLVETGKVHRIASLNAFVLCKYGQHHQPTDAQEHSDAQPPSSIAFTICDRCGIVEECDDMQLLPKPDRRQRKDRFIPLTIAVEIHGFCATCAHDAFARKTSGGELENVSTAERS